MDINKLIKTLKIAERTEKDVVYCAVNKKNLKVYVGYTKSTLYRRIISHNYCARNSIDNNFFHNALLKYGLENFDWYVIFASSKLKELKLRERKFIELLKSNQRQFGYNLSNGGESPTFSQETRNKISRKAKSRELFGTKNPFYGKTHSLATRKHWSKIRKGKCNNLGYKHSKKIKEKLSQIRKRLCKNPDHILTMRLAQKSKPIICLSNSVIYCSINEAARQLNIKRSGIKAQLHGRTKTYMGMTFKFT